MKRLSVSIVVTMLLGSFIAGCGKEAVPKDEGAAAPSDAPAQVSTEPITLNILWSGREEEFNDRVNNEFVKSLLPNVTFQFYSLGTGMEKLLVSGVKLDVLNITTKVYYEALRLNLNYDMTDLIRRQKFDMNRFVPEHVDAIKKLSKDGKMYAVPDKANFPYALHAMVYNKDIFDKFAVPYPKDNMTWDQVLELARRLNRSDNGTQYYGIGLGTSQYMYEAAELSYTDAKGNIDLSNPLFEKIFNVYQEAYKITGKETLGNVDPFTKDKNVAMFAGNVDKFIQESERQKDSYPNWDIVTFPSFSEKPNKVPPTNGVYMVASTSEHKVEALRLIDLLLAPENNKKIEQQFMNAEFVKKNVNAVKSPKQSLYVPGEFDSIGNSIFNNMIRAMNKDSVDINTSLRGMKEQIQKQMDEKK
ncbi:ABC transporter substrate-binding protein [Paenibacillus sp. UNC451MF]|uniref:ABC transporter substrate-binding protein n=1 Tax=Paenibacillus sp. UNC451MF TaxID=1449063 RepID=UPI000491F4E5|nr:extracellular solute-binding protein [Paenibacillus sp. UNC451MF]